MNIILLTHEREVGRPTNTGQLALTRYPNWCKQVQWSRTQPDTELTSLLKAGETNGEAGLLYPMSEEAVLLGSITGSEQLKSEPSSHTLQAMGSNGLVLSPLPSHLVILDATWQEARKMLNKSPYLKSAKKFKLDAKLGSEFHLRRNQIEGGLCTIECIIGLCQLANMEEEAAQLQLDFQSLKQRLRN